MQKREVDVAIIGAGTAGLGAFHEARKLTRNLLLIEGGAYGTTCARVGCMPSKLMIAAADAAHEARRAGLFGVQVDGVEISGREVMGRIQRERDRFVGSVLDAVERIPQTMRLRGSARFVGPNRLRVDDSLEVEAGRIVIATGSRPYVPDLLRVAGDRLLTSDSLFELKDLPGSVAVFGAGAIGLELGQALARLGVDVRMFGRGGGIGPIREESLRQEAHSSFNEEFYLDPDARVHHVAGQSDGVAVTYRHRTRGDVTEVFDYLLAATGRRPDLSQLGMEHSGLTLDEKGMPDHDHATMRCGDSAIFLAGDASNEIPLLHEASDEGHIAGVNAGRYPDVQPGARRTPLAIVFTDPQIVTVGLTLDQLEERRQCYGVGEVSFANQGRSRVIGRNRGLLRVYGERGSGLLLGAEMFGPAAEHMGHLLAWAVQSRMTVPQMLGMPFYHPVIEEGLRTALRDLNQALELGPGMLESSVECGPGA